MARNYLLARGMELRLRCSFSGFKVRFLLSFFCVVLDCLHYITLMVFIQDSAHNFYMYFLQQTPLHLSYLLEQKRCTIYNNPHPPSPNVVAITTKYPL